MSCFNMLRLVHRPSAKKQAFTLIELAIVLAILGLGVGGALTLLTSQDERARIERTALILDGLEEALESFYIANGRLPCPAPKNLAVTAAGFGLEWDAGEPCENGSSGTEPNTDDEIRIVYDNDTDDDTEEVWIGAVPTRTLGLQDRFAFDGWESKLTYAIPRALGNPNDHGAFLSRATPVPEENIIIIDKEGAFDGSPAHDDALIAPNRINPLDEEVAYVFVAHGPDKVGALPRAGGTTPIEACDASGDATKDNINCVHVVNTGPADVEYATFRDQRVNDGEEIPANFYYDFIRWKTLNNFRYQTGALTLSQTCSTAVIAPTGFPDAITCTDGSFVNMAYNYYHTSATSIQYRDPSGTRQIGYLLSNGNYNSSSSAAAFDCVTNSWSIADLEAQNQTVYYGCGN